MPRARLLLSIASICVCLSLAATVYAERSDSTDLEVYGGCGMEGDAHSPAVQALNRLKNRYNPPKPEQLGPAITLEAMLAPGKDTGRWKVQQGAEITGYVFDVKIGGIESTNCHARAAEQRDTHIELVLDPMVGSPTQRLIVEVTPRWRAIMTAQGMDWSSRALRDRLLGRWIKIRGWMLFDVEHWQNPRTLHRVGSALEGCRLGGPPDHVHRGRAETSEIANLAQNPLHHRLCNRRLGSEGFNAQ